MKSIPEQTGDNVGVDNKIKRNIHPQELPEDFSKLPQYLQKGILITTSLRIFVEKETERQSVSDHAVGRVVSQRRSILSEKPEGQGIQYILVTQQLERTSENTVHIEKYFDRKWPTGLSRFFVIVNDPKRGAVKIFKIEHEQKGIKLFVGIPNEPKKEIIREKDGLSRLDDILYQTSEFTYLDKTQENQKVIEAFNNGLQTLLLKLHFCLAVREKGDVRQSMRANFKRVKRVREILRSK